MSDKIRAVIVDDEETAIDNLCFELKKYQWISVEGVARNGKAGIRLIEKEHPDLLFLDVELPDMLGMDVAIKVHEMQNWNMHIIFYTAYNKYLIDALRNYAFDFLLKPVDPQELAVALERLQTADGEKDSNNFLSDMNRGGEKSFMVVTPMGDSGSSGVGYRLFPVCVRPENMGGGFDKWFFYSLEAEYEGGKLVRLRSGFCADSPVVYH